MNYQDVQIGQQVVRSKGYYTIGKVGKVVDVNEKKQRACVAWAGENKTWVSVDVIEPTIIPYEITAISERKNGGVVWPKYKRI